MGFWLITKELTPTLHGASCWPSNETLTPHPPPWTFVVGCYAPKPLFSERHISYCSWFLWANDDNETYFRDIRTSSLHLMSQSLNFYTTSLINLSLSKSIHNLHFVHIHFHSFLNKTRHKNKILTYIVLGTSR